MVSVPYPGCPDLLLTPDSHSAGSETSLSVTMVVILSISLIVTDLVRLYNKTVMGMFDMAKISYRLYDNWRHVQYTCLAKFVGSAGHKQKPNAQFLYHNLFYILCFSKVKNMLYVKKKKTIRQWKKHLITEKAVLSIRHYSTTDK